jgi:hypothetical protein
MKSAIDGSGGSRVATTGVTKVGGSTQFTSLAVPDTFKPSAFPSVAPSTAPTAFVGPIPAKATRTDTGYTTGSGTAVTPTPAPKPAPSPTPTINTSSVSAAPQSSSSTPSMASSNQFKLKPYVNPPLSPGATVMSWDSTVSDEEKKRSAASGKAALQTAYEFTGIPAASRLSTGSSPKILEKQLGSGWKSKAAGTALDVAMALPIVGKAAKVAAATGVLGKTAQSIGAADAALKGGRALKDVAGTKAAAGVAATAMTLAPPVGNLVDAAKAGTAITQSAKVGKAAKTIDTFVPSAAKAASKETSSIAKSVEAAPKKAPTSTGFSAGTKAKTASAVAVGKVGSSIATVVKAQDATKSTVDNQAQTKTNDSRANQFKAEANKPSGTEGKTNFKGIDAKEFKDPTNTKNPDVIKHKGQAPDEAAYNAQDIINDVKPFQAVVEAGGSGTEGPTPPEAPKKPKEPKKRRIPHIKIKTDGRQWNPSSIV